MAEYAPCPKCSCTRAKKAGFTWWGGYVGPKLLTHVKCEECGTAYNGKTGQSNARAIFIYNVIGLIVGIGLLIVFMPYLKELKAWLRR